MIPQARPMTEAGQDTALALTKEIAYSPVPFISESEGNTHCHRWAADPLTATRHVGDDGGDLVRSRLSRRVKSVVERIDLIHWQGGSFLYIGGTLRDEIPL